MCRPVFLKRRRNITEAKAWAGVVAVAVAEALDLGCFGLIPLNYFHAINCWVLFWSGHLVTAG